MQKSFTLIEIIVVIVIIAVLGTILMPAYFNTLEKSKNIICETNQKVLLGALESYALENTVLPASLSQLPDKNIEKAWVKILSQPGSWKIRLAYAVAELSLEQLAYAATSWISEYINTTLPRCPASPPGVDFSYGISFEFANQPSSELLNAPMGALVIADSNDTEFIEPIVRHKKYRLFGSNKFAISITRAGEIIHYPEDVFSLSLSSGEHTECIAYCAWQFTQCSSTPSTCKYARNDCLKFNCY